MKSKSLVLKLICLALLSVLAVGCGGGGNDDFDFNDDFIDVDPPAIPPNNLPFLFAQFDSYDVPQDTILQVDELFGVLANDEFPVFETVVEYPFQTVNGGDLEGFQNGSFEYDPPLGFFGQDSFTYTLRDNNGRTSSAEVFISVTQ